MTSQDLRLPDEEESKLRFAPLDLKALSHPAWKLVQHDLNYLSPWIKPHHARLKWSLLFFLISTTLSLSIPRLVGFIVDHSLLKNGSDFYLYFGLLITVMLAKLITDYIYKYLVVKVGQNITQHIRREMYQALHQKELHFFDINSSGKIISRTVGDINNLSQFFTTQVFSVIADVILIAGALMMMLTLSLPLSISIAIALWLIFLYMLNVTIAMIDWSKFIRAQLSRVSMHVTDTMNNLSVLHLHPFASFWLNRAYRIQKIFEKTTFRGIKIWGLFSSTHVLCMGVVLSLSLSLGIYFYQNKMMSLGHLVSFISYIYMSFQPFIDISEKLNTLLQSLTSVARMKYILPGPQPLEGLKLHDPIARISPPAGNMTIENVRFSYHEKPVLKNIHMEIPAHRVTAIVGRTGAGKSTLAQLLMGLYPVHTGKIFWGEYNWDKISQDQKQKLVGVVSQEIFFFEDSILQNLKLYREDISLDDVNYWLKTFELDKKISHLPMQLLTKLDKSSMPFSQGEKQLLMLIRLLLQRPCLLIFDEATAHLDPKAEDIIFKAMDSILEKHTVLMIAHRLPSLKLAEKVYVLDQGEILKEMTKTKGQSLRLEDLQ